MKIIAKIVPILLFAFQTSLFGQSGGRVAPGTVASRQPTPQYRISFEAGDPVRGVNYLPVFVLPFECTADGTVYVEMLVANRIVDPSSLGSRVLAGITSSGDAHSYSVADVPDLSDMEQVSRFAWDSGVGFLVRALKGKPGDKGAEYHDYVVTFKLDGERQDTILISDTFRAIRVGVFPSSGHFLIYGYDVVTSRPKLALFGNDGTLLKELQIGKGLMRESAAARGSEMKELGLDKALTDESAAASGTEKGAPQIIAPVQFVPYQDSLILVQTNTDFPLIEIRDGGAIRVIRPKLPQNEKLYSLIASDGNLFARVNNNQRSSIYEIDADTGDLLRKFKALDNEDGSNIACVHQSKFLSFEHDWAHGHALIPLWGTPEPVMGGATAAK